MKNTTKKAKDCFTKRGKNRFWGQLTLFVFLLLSLETACEKKPAPQKPAPFSMNRLAQLYVKVRLIETASGNQVTKRDTLQTVLEKNHFSTDSVQAILAYFKANPNAWVSFYKRVERLARPKPSESVHKKNPVSK